MNIHKYYFYMRLDSFDLNLLVALDALLAECSVTRAAERLNVTQSAMSASLKRLREALGDELLVQSGRNMIPTANALVLAPRVTEELLRLRSLLSTGTAFEPANSTRRFRIAASDYITTVLLVPVQRLLQSEAPGISMEISLPEDGTAERLAKGDFDLVLTPREFVAANHPSELLFEERQVVVGCKDNPIFAQAIDIDTFKSARHAAVRIDGRNTFIENALDKLGIALRPEVIAPSFIQLPHFLPGTNLITLMHERLARQMARILPLAIVRAPFSIPPMQEMAQYHSARVGDDGLKWLMGRMQGIASAS